MNWKTHINESSTKLIKGNLIKSKLQHFANKDILLSMCYAFFQAHLAYLCLVLDQAKYSEHAVTIELSDRTMRRV